MASVDTLNARVGELLGDALTAQRIDRGELTIDVVPARIVAACEALRDDPQLRFEQLIDLCGVDYSAYGCDDAGKPWQTTGSGQFNPGAIQGGAPDGQRFAVVYHLQSVSLNHRLRVRAHLPDDDFPAIDSAIRVWPAADWYEREAFDLFGIMFEGHPDLRRLLTDYGFIGHPFRKDFPLSGQVEMRYDADKGRVVYGPVSIPRRILVPRVIRDEGFGDRNP